MTEPTASTPRDDLPLSGFRVVEFSQMVAAPSAALLLADYGAEVIKIEPPGGDNVRLLRSQVATDLPVSPVFLGYNRGKRLIRLDLRDPDQLNEAKRLIEGADVMIESSRPGAMTRLGLGPDAMRLTGPAEQPMKVGFTMVDAASGHALCHGILAALLRRERKGSGEHVQVSLYDVALHLQTGPLAEFQMTGHQAPRSGNSAPLAAPADLLRCGDGAIVISAYLDAHWLRFVEAIGGAQLATDPRFASGPSRIDNRTELIAELESLLAAQSAAHWEEKLAAEGLLVGQVKDHAQVCDSPYTLESNALASGGELPGVHNPAQLECTTREGFAAPTECSAQDIDWLTDGA